MFRGDVPAVGLRCCSARNRYRQGVVNRDKLDIPPAWSAIDVSAVRGAVLVVGAPDAGKSTFVRYLYGRLVEANRQVAVLDGDPGQSTIGPPTTMTIAMRAGAGDGFPPSGQRWQQFVGAVTPVGNMLRVVVGAGRLAEAARDAGADVILYDTTGLVDAEQGGHYLKLAKIDLLQPSAVIALQRDGALEGLLQALRRRVRLRVIALPPSEAVRERSRAERQAHRARRFERYFNGAGTLTVFWPRVAVLPAPRFDRDRLVALEDECGFVRALGVVEEVDSEACSVTLRTPLASPDAIDAIRIGEVGVNPDTFRDRPMGKL